MPGATQAREVSAMEMHLNHHYRSLWRELRHVSHKRVLRQLDRVFATALSSVIQDSPALCIAAFLVCALQLFRLDAEERTWTFKNSSHSDPTQK